MNVDRLIELGFERRGGDLRAPAGTGVSLTPLDGRCCRVTIALPTGDAVTFVVAAVALRTEVRPMTVGSSSEEGANT
jgi:hypothetical protein